MQGGESPQRRPHILHACRGVRRRDGDRTLLRCTDGGAHSPYTREVEGRERREAAHGCSQPLVRSFRVLQKAKAISAPRAPRDQIQKNAPAAAKAAEAATEEEKEAEDSAAAAEAARAKAGAAAEAARAKAGAAAAAAMEKPAAAKEEDSEAGGAAEARRCRA
jgi:colicin import membrane protein